MTEVENTFLGSDPFILGLNRYCFPVAAQGHSLFFLSARCSWSQECRGHRANASTETVAAEEHMAEAHCGNLTLSTT